MITENGIIKKFIKIENFSIFFEFYDHLMKSEVA